MNNDGTSIWSLPTISPLICASFLVTVTAASGSRPIHSSTSIPILIRSVVVADFDSDGKLDAATDSWGNNEIEILRGDGMGRLITPAAFSRPGVVPMNGSALRTSTMTATRTSSPPILTTVRYPSCWAMAAADCGTRPARRSLRGPNPGSLSLTTSTVTAIPISLSSLISATSVDRQRMS